MKQARFLLTLLVGALLLPAGAPGAAEEAEAVAVKGAIEAVTVYRGQALVTRRIEANLPRGSSDLVVTDLPAQIVPESLFASGDAGVQIRGVRYRTRAVREEPREEVRKIEKAMEDVQVQIRHNQSLQKLRAQKEQYLGRLEAFTSEKVRGEMAKGALNFETIKSMTGFVFEQREAMTQEGMKLEEEARGLQEKLSLLQRQRAELTSQWSRTAREAVLFLDKRRAGKATLRLNYLVAQASWQPMYNLRCDGKGRQVALEYNALVQQMSGEDWNGVKLTLSTASPSMLAEAPLLTPLWVALRAGPAKGAQPVAGVVYRGQREAETGLRQAMRQRAAQAGGKPGGRVEGDWGLNTWANRLQMLDLTAGRDVLLAGGAPEAADEALSVNYDLPGSLTVASRSDQQMIQIASLKLQGEFYYLAVPMLTSYVYQQADIVNTSDVALLSGPVNSYVAGQFMGSGRIPMVAKGQRFTVGFGVDSQLRAARELADKADRIQGGNRELTFKYRLLIANYKDEKVQVRLMDRIPDPKGADVRVTLISPGEPLTQDKVYLRTIRRMGILRWQIDVPAKAAGATAKTLEYEFKMEFDRNMRVAEPPAQQVELQKEEFKKALQKMMMSQ